MKRILKLSSLLLAAMLLLASCFIEINGGSYQCDDYIYVKGTAVRNKNTGLYDFASARIEVDYSDISDKLEPVDPRNLVNPIEDNVLFRCPNTRFSFIRYESTPEPGYVFDEWKVRKLSELVDTEEDWTYEYRTAKEGIEEAERYLSERKTVGKMTIENRYSPTLEMLDVDLLPYIYPEYNRAPVVLVPVAKSNLPYDYEGNGTTEKPYTLDEFRELNKDRKEINVLVRVKDTIANNDLSRFFTELSYRAEYPSLEEVHIKLSKRTNTNADIGTLLDRFDYVEIENVEFGNINLTGDSNTSWKFRNCHFNSLTIDAELEVVLEDCTYDNLWKKGSTNVVDR